MMDVQSGMAYGFGDGRWMAQKTWVMYNSDDVLHQQYSMLSVH